MTFIVVNTQIIFNFTPLHCTAMVYKVLVLLVIHLVHEWNIVIFPEFNELKLVFHEAQPSGIQDFNELNEGNMIIFHEWTK